MKIRITGKGLPRAQYGNPGTADLDMNAMFNAENPAAPGYQTGQLANTGIGPLPDAYTQQYNADPKMQRKYDRSLLRYHMWNPNEDSASYMDFYTKKYPNSFWPTAGKVMDKANKFGHALDVVSMAAGMLDDRSRRKDMFKWYAQNRLPDNMFAPMNQSASGNRGDYDVNNGMFRPDELGFKSKGMYTGAFYGPMNFAEYGGETMSTPMRIRITSLPKQMAYGGQAEGGYGLDLGSKRIFNPSDLPEPSNESVSNTIGPVPREMANIEAERGETVYGDMDGDGQLEHMKISGKRHAQGGTPLNVPEGSFIFSDTKKMRINDPEILTEFGLKPRKGGYTPAEIAKRYDINKYKAIMEDPDSDELRKQTAQMMVDNFNQKLSMLTMVQEGMKGFPDGKPKVVDHAATQPKAAYGGELPKAQNGKNNNPIFTSEFQDILTGLQNDKGYEMIYSPRMIQGDNFVPSMQHKQKSGLYGDVTADEFNEFKQRHAWYFKDRPNFNFSNPKDVLDFQTRYDEEFAKQHGYSYFSGSRRFDRKDGYLGEYTYNAPALRSAQKEDVVKPQYVCIPGQGVSAIKPGTASQYTAVYDDYNKALEACQAKVKEQDRPDPADVNVTGKPRQAPFGYMTPDLVNMWAAAAYPPKMYLPYIADVPFEPGRVAFEDWRGKAAARQSAYNNAASMLGQYQTGPGMAAQEAFLAGLQGEGVTQDIAQVDARNVQTANAFDSQERQRKDQNNLLRALNATERYKGTVIAKQNLDNSLRKYTNNLAKTYGQAWANRMYLDMLNHANPYFNVDPFSGRSFFTSGKGFDQFGSSGSASGGIPDIRMMKQRYIDNGWSEKAAEDMIKRQYAATASSGRGASMANLMGLMNAYRGASGMGRSPFGYSGYSEDDDE